MSKPRIWKRSTPPGGWACGFSPLSIVVGHGETPSIAYWAWWASERARQDCSRGEHAPRFAWNTARA